MPTIRVVTTALMMALSCVLTQAQQSAATNPSTVVPTLINYSGTLTDTNEPS